MEQNEKQRLEKIIRTEKSFTDEELFKEILSLLEKQRHYARLLYNEEYVNEEEEKKFEVYLYYIEKQIRLLLALI